MHRASITAIPSMCLAVLLSVVFAGQSAAGASPSGPAIPTSFHAQSVTWVSPSTGWMLGSAQCASSTCATVAGTTDGGQTWSKLGSMDAPVTYEAKSGVTEIRFADELHGWAFDPALWATNDGGVTWTKVTPPGGRPLVALAADADAVYAVVSACGFGHPIGTCTHPTTLWRTTPGGGSWTQVSITLPETNQAILAVHGPVGYLAVTAFLIDGGRSTPADALEVTVDGETWSPRPDPCMPAEGETLTGVAPISDTDVALLCQGNIGFGKAEKRVFRSNDTGQTTHPAGTMSIWGITTQLTATPSGTLVASSFSIGSWMYRNAGGTTWTTQEDLGDGGMGWNDIVFTTDQVGYVIHGPAALCCKGFSGQLWKTDDGGLTWGPA